MESKNSIDERIINGIVDITHIKPFYNKEASDLWNLFFFSNHKIIYGSITLKFPEKATELKEKQVQKINYENTLRTISDLIKKYGLDIEEWEE